MRIFLFALLLATPVAQAQSLYKCVGSDGVPSFQSQPCGPGQQLRAVHDATPERLSNEEQWRRYNARQKAASDAAYLRRLADRHKGSGSAAAVPVTSNGCTAARARRTQAYADYPRMSVATRSEWERIVYDACK